MNGALSSALFLWKGDISAEKYHDLPPLLQADNFSGKIILIAENDSIMAFASVKNAAITQASRNKIYFYDLDIIKNASESNEIDERDWPRWVRRLFPNHVYCPDFNEGNGADWWRDFWDSFINFIGGITGTASDGGNFTSYPFIGGYFYGTEGSIIPTNLNGGGGGGGSSNTGGEYLYTQQLNLCSVLQDAMNASGDLPENTSNADADFCTLANSGMITPETGAQLIHFIGTTVISDLNNIIAQYGNDDKVKNAITTCVNLYNINLQSGQATSAQTKFSKFYDIMKRVYVFGDNVTLSVYKVFRNEIDYLYSKLEWVNNTIGVKAGGIDPMDIWDKLEVELIGIGAELLMSSQLAPYEIAGVKFANGTKITIKYGGNTNPEGYTIEIKHNLNTVKFRFGL